MKLKFRHRVVLYMGAVVVLAIGMVLIIAGFQFSSIILRPEGKVFTPIRLFVWLMGLLLVVYALFILVTQETEAKTGQFSCAEQWFW